MKYAKIKNGKVIHVINGLAPDDYVEVIQKWIAPTPYPVDFYVTGSNEPIVSIEGDEVHENWLFILKSVDSIKDDIYVKHSKKRDKAEETPVIYLAKEFDISTERKRNGILTLKATKDKKLKVKNNEWIDLTKAQVAELQDLVDDTIQGWFDAEYSDNTEVDALTTHDELLAYVTS